MSMRTRLVILAVAPVMFLVSCSSPDAPEGQGSVVLRFEPLSPDARVARAGGTALAFDSVAVCVFRPGFPVRQEACRGVTIGTDPVQMAISCVAEAGKRVSVELFVSGEMRYHGVDENVDVVANGTTAVTIDAFPFFVPALEVTPGMVYDGASFGLSWPSTPGARGYRVESSRNPDFAAIEWQQSRDDTFATVVLTPGAHYFRVAPETPYATGTFAGPEFRYVLGGTSSLVVTGLSAVGVIPGDEFAIYGENLDFPGVHASVGGERAEIVLAAWGELTVRMPAAARSGHVAVGSELGSDTSSDSLVALRLAFVSASGVLAGAFNDVLLGAGGDVEWSGVAHVPLQDLDTRDMSVFDVIIVAGDTGATPSDWGAGVPLRADAIVSSGANVLAVGDGGAAFMRLAISMLGAVPSRATTQTSCYVTEPAAALFTSPHSVTGGSSPQWVDISTSPARCVAFEMSTGTATPVSALYATSAAASVRWVFLDAELADGVFPQRCLFWGFDGDPREYTPQGQSCLRNAVYQLYRP